MANDHVPGFHVIEALLVRAPERILQVFAASERRDSRTRQLEERLGELGITLQRCAPGRLDELSAGVVHQGVVAEVRRRPELDEKALLTYLQTQSVPLVCVLDGVQDPRNLGACIRTAEAAGAAAVVLPRDKASGLTPVARKAAAGAAELIVIARVANLARTLTRLQQTGIWIVGADAGTEQELYALSLTGPLALVLGAEGSGLRRLTRESCDVLARIPLPGNSGSLNVSVATGVCLFEALRQRAGTK